MSWESVEARLRVSRLSSAATTAQARTLTRLKGVDLTKDSSQAMLWKHQLAQDDRDRDGSFMDLPWFMIPSKSDNLPRDVRATTACRHHHCPHMSPSGYDVDTGRTTLRPKRNPRGSDKFKLPLTGQSRRRNRAR